MRPVVQASKSLGAGSGEGCDEAVRHTPVCSRSKRRSSLFEKHRELVGHIRANTLTLHGSHELDHISGRRKRRFTTSICASF